MSWLPIKLRPGTDTVSTPLLAESTFVETTNIRFLQGKLQQIGNFQSLTAQKPRGTCRGLFPWADTSGNQYIAEGTTNELAVINNGTLYDITPTMGTTEDLSTPLATQSGMTTVTISDSSNQAVVGNWINITSYVWVENLLLQGAYEIQTIGSNFFTINAPIAATGTISNSGATSLFATTDHSPTVQVTLDNHGFAVNSIYTVFISTIVGGITLYGQYVVTHIIDTNNFNIVATSEATSSTTGSENGGQIQVEYLIATGLTSAGGIAGYGQMPYGLGPYGLGEFEANLPLRQWFFGAWGSFLIAQPTNGAIYVWMPANGFFNNPAVIISQAPAFNTAIFIAIEQQQIIALGAQDSVSGDQDPLLIRWCDVADYTDWTATVINQAGSFRIPVGSKIVGGISVSLQSLIWTDLGLWSMAYIGAPFIYGFTQIASGCGLISARAMAPLANAVIWMSQKGFFLYSGGSVIPIPCPIWDTIFNNLNYTQQDKITSAPNSSFTEMVWHLPSVSGNGENDTIIKLNMIDGSWDYSNGTNAQVYVRTAAYDQSLVGPPMGVDLSSILQQSETGVSANGLPIVSSARTGWFKLDNGQEKISIERLIPDFIINGNPTLTLSVYTANYPGDMPVLWSTQPVTSSTEYVIIRSRSRLAAIQIDCTSNNGSFWRLGEILAKAYQTGRGP